MKKDCSIFYGWYIVVTGTLAYAFGYGARYSFSVIFPSLLDEFQWPRDATAVMLSLHILSYGFVAPVAGGLVDRVGPRKTMSLGALLLGLGLALSGLGSKLWHFYLTFGALSGAGLCFMGAVPFTTVVRNWFEEKRGRALSVLFFGAGAAFAFYPAVAYMIDTITWRKTFLVEALAISGIMLPLIGLVIRYHPLEKGLHPDGLSQGGDRSKAEGSTKELLSDDLLTVEWTLFKAMRTIPFWLLCLSTFSLWGVGQHLIVTHHVAFAMDLGYSRIYASAVLSMFGMFFAFGSLLGFVSDRIGREITMTLATAISVFGIVVLLLMRDASRPWMLYLYATTWGLGNGMTAPTIAASVTDIFKGRKVGAILGSLWFSFAVGGFIGPWLGGWIFEKANSYLLAFAMSMLLYVIACAAIWCAAPRKTRKAKERRTDRGRSAHRKNQ